MGPGLSHTAVCHSGVSAPSPPVSHGGYKSVLVHSAHSEHSFNIQVNRSTLIVTEPERLVVMAHKLLGHFVVGHFVREQVKVCENRSLEKFRGGHVELPSELFEYIFNVL